MATEKDQPDITTFENIPGIRYPFHLFIPPKVKHKYVVVWGHGSYRGPDLINATKKEFSNFKKTFTRLGLITLMPVLPRIDEKDLHKQLDAQLMEQPTITGKCQEFYSRPDLVILKIIKHAQKLLREQRYAVRKKIIIGGSSAGGTMANRMSVLHTSLVAGAVIFISGSFMYIEREINNIPLPYPYGIRDIDEIEDNHFNRIQFLKIPSYIFIGKHDTNPDNDPFGFEIRHFQDREDELGSIFGNNQLERTKHYANYLKKLGMKVELRIHPSYGHMFDYKEIRKGFRWVLRQLP